MYKSYGFKYIETNWIENTDMIRTTAAESGIIHVNMSGVEGEFALIGSGEQSFISNFNKLYGKYQTCTPCFRMEQDFTDLNKMQFMKIELFRNDIISNEALFKMMDCVKDVMTAEFNVDPIIVKTGPESWDININGIEVGSYGRRSIKHNDVNYTFLYGTGLAEPRFSQACYLS
jgi:hypothetical protein